NNGALWGSVHDDEPLDVSGRSPSAKAEAKSKRSPGRGNQWANQTQIGKKLGTNAIAVGRLLVAAGLRNPHTKEPTDKARELDLAQPRKLRDGTEFHVWRKDPTVKLLRTVA